jgi:hypothetical protein
MVIDGHETSEIMASGEYQLCFEVLVKFEAHISRHCLMWVTGSVIDSQFHFILTLPFWG